MKTVGPLPEPQSRQHRSTWLTGTGRCRQVDTSSTTPFFACRTQHLKLPVRATHTSRVKTAGRCRLVPKHCPSTLALLAVPRYTRRSAGSSLAGHRTWSRPVPGKNTRYSSQDILSRISSKPLAAELSSLPAINPNSISTYLPAPVGPSKQTAVGRRKPHLSKFHDSQLPLSCSRLEFLPCHPPRIQPRERTGHLNCPRDSPHLEVHLLGCSVRSMLGIHQARQGACLPPSPGRDGRPASMYPAPD